MDSVKIGYGKTSVMPPRLCRLISPSFIFVMLMLAAALSCNGAEKPEAPSSPNLVVHTPTPTPINPQAVLDQSGIVMNALQSFHFRLEHNTSGTPLAPSLILISTEGYVVKPDKLSLSFVGSAGNFAMRGDVITIGTQTYMSNPLNDEWQVLEGQVSPLAYFDPALGISSMMSQITSVTVLEVHSDEIHIGGHLPASALSPLFGPTTDGSIQVELTIDLHNSYLTDAKLIGRITETEVDGVERTIELDEFDEPVVIEPPL